jgi:CRP-like cAMP-binding protein
MIVIMSSSLVDTLSRLKGRKQELPAGDILFRVGDPVLSLFLVVAGVLRLTRALPHGLELTLQRAGPGAILAEASLFADIYHCDASAAEDSVLRVVPLRRIRATLTEDSDLAFALARDLAHDLYHARAHVEILRLRRSRSESMPGWCSMVVPCHQRDAGANLPRKLALHQRRCIASLRGDSDQ